MQREIPETRFVDLPIRIPLTSDALALVDIAEACGAVIAGGFARYVAGLRASEDDEVAGFGDVDIWPLFTAPSAFKTTVTPMAAVKKLEVNLALAGYVERVRTEAAITYEDSWMAMSRVQVIHYAMRWWAPDAEAIMQKFDYTICQAALVRVDGDLRVRASEAFVADEPARRLRVNRLQNPMQLIRRAVKYARRGYTLPVPQIAAILTQWTPESTEAWNAEVANALAASGAEALTEQALEEIGYRLMARTGLAE